WNGHPGRRSSDAEREHALGGLALDHGNLSWRQQLPGQHLSGADAGSEQGADKHGSYIKRESIGVRTECYLHSDGDIGRAADCAAWSGPDVKDANHSANANSDRESQWSDDQCQWNRHADGNS